MKNKRRFKAFVGFNWHWYLLISICVFVGFYFVFTSLNTPTYDEKVVVFIASEYVDGSLGEDLYLNLDDSEIEEVFVDFSDPKDNDFSIVFNTRGLVNTDIVIMSDGYLKTGDYARYFSSFNEELFLGEQYFYDNELCYGIDVSSYLEDYISDDEKYYLFFNKKSPKIGVLSADSLNDYALIVAKNLLSLEG